MTSEIQWEEDWFSVSDLRLEELSGETTSGATVSGATTNDTMKESVESIKEWIEKDIREQERDQERQQEQMKSVNQRMDRLERLVHHQNEIIRGLGSELQTLQKEVQELKGELHSTSRTSMTHLLEELKWIKERELNYALRRHQPIPFFDSRNLMQMVGSVGSIGSVESPLFRRSVQKTLPHLHL